MEDTPDEVSLPPITDEPELESEYSDGVAGEIKEFEKKIAKLTSIITKINEDNKNLNREIIDLKKNQRDRDSRLKHELRNLKNEIESDSGVLATSTSAYYDHSLAGTRASFERIEKLYNTVKILAAKADVDMGYDLRYTTRPHRASMKTSKKKKKSKKNKRKRKTKTSSK
tara:strand:- start:66 stop:575 length:510 start_codon:yes stop_codon:yes gene_type:complete